MVYYEDNKNVKLKNTDSYFVNNMLKKIIIQLKL